MDPRLSKAARTGNIDDLYTLIHEDPYILEPIDQVPFVDTPLHIAAASEGGHHINFAMEMMNLKPSFARKLNQDGWSPIHIAVMNNEEAKAELLVIRFLETDKGLARVKGREGMTPLHLAATKGNLDLLFELLEACPECIQDVTVNNDTALHLALKNDQIKAFDLLMGWLHNSINGSPSWRGKILNWKDNEENTLLHIAAKKSQHKELRQLLNSRFVKDVNVKNSNGLTALEIINPESVQNQVIVQSSCDESETKYSKYLEVPNPQSPLQRIEEYLVRWKKDLSIEMLNIILVVTALVITATYQSSLNPPGGVFPADSNNSSSSSPISNTTSHNANPWKSSTFYVKPESPGTPVMSSWSFVAFWMSNTMTLVSAICITVWLLVPKFTILLLPLSNLGFCYYTSMLVLSPSTTWAVINYFAMIVMFLLPIFTGVISLLPNIKMGIMSQVKKDFLKVLDKHNGATTHNQV